MPIGRVLSSRCYVGECPNCLDTFDTDAERFKGTMAKAWECGCTCTRCHFRGKVAGAFVDKWDLDYRGPGSYAFRIMTIFTDSTVAFSGDLFFFNGSSSIFRDERDEQRYLDEHGKH